MAKLSYNKGFIVNTSAIAAKSLDLGAEGASSSDALLAAAVAETRRKEAQEKAGKDAEEADKEFLKSLSDGSIFAPTNGSYAGGSYYNGGSYGSFVTGESDSPSADAILAEIVAQSGTGEDILDGGTHVEPGDDYPHSEDAKPEEPAWKGIVRRYKWWIIGIAAAVVYFVLRRKK